METNGVAHRARYRDMLAEHRPETARTTFGEDGSRKPIGEMSAAEAIAAVQVMAWELSTITAETRRVMVREADERGRLEPYPDEVSDRATSDPRWTPLIYEAKALHSFFLEKFGDEMMPELVVPELQE